MRPSALETEQNFNVTTTAATTAAEQVADRFHHGQIVVDSLPQSDGHLLSNSPLIALYRADST